MIVCCGVMCDDVCVLLGSVLCVCWFGCVFVVFLVYVDVLLVGWVIVCVDLWLVVLHVVCL